MASKAQESGTGAYAVIYVSLMVLLALTVMAAFVDLSRYVSLPGVSIIVAMGIAAAKTLLIVLFFMHVRGAPGRVLMFAVTGFVWLGLLFVLTFADYATRGTPAPGLNIQSPPFLDSDARSIMPTRH